MTTMAMLVISAALVVMLAGVQGLSSVNGTLLTAGSGSTNNSTTSVDDQPELLHVPLNGTVEFDCDQRLAVIVEPAVRNETANTTTTTFSAPATTTASPNGYVLVIFKKDGLVVQVSNPKMRVVALGAQNEGSYECGHHQLDRYGKLNYAFQKAWTIKIDYPKVEVKTTTPETVARGEVAATPASLVELVDLDKKNINIFTYSNPAIVFVLVAGFLVICATFLVIILLLNVKTCRSCQHPRGKELL